MAAKSHKTTDGSYLKIYHPRSYDSFFQELKALKRLNKVGSIYFPKLLGYQDEGNKPYLQLSNCGFPVTMTTLPNDFQLQIQEISQILDCCGINQRDPSPGNLLVKDGILRFIDFGHAEVQDQCIRFYNIDSLLPCDYIEEYADITLYIPHYDTKLESSATDVLTIFKTPVYNNNFFALQNLIENL